MSAITECYLLWHGPAAEDRLDWAQALFWQDDDTKNQTWAIHIGWVGIGLMNKTKRYDI